MKKLLLVVMVALTLNAESLWDGKLINKYMKDLDRLTEQQYNTMIFAYTMGVGYDMGYTTTAIAWEESNFGTLMFNSITGDYGLMGVNLKWHLIREKIKSSYYTKIRVASKLIRNDNLNMSIAISELRMWQKKYGKDWIKIWGSYNGGSTPNYAYSKRIVNRIIAIKKWLARDGLTLGDLNGL